jgi:DNA-binding NarL/FixJ family response regulator
LLRRVRFRIVMLTGHSDRGLVERAIAAGAFTYLVKPFRETDVVPAVRAAAARHGELLAARRVVGSSADSIEIGLPSPSGNVWPLRVHRLADGSVRFSGVAAREESPS